MKPAFCLKEKTVKTITMVTIQAALLLAVAGCGTIDQSPEVEKAQLQAGIQKFANLPLDQFLPAYFSGSSGSFDTIVMKRTVRGYAYASILRPRLILEIYCEDNNGALLRIPNSQIGFWMDTSPDAFADARTARSAEMSLQSMSLGDNPGYGLAQASRDGAFGIFECRENKTSRSLWKAEVRQSGVAMIDQTNRVRATVELMIQIKK